ncbi:MAG TPA: helix-turn-helix domain-containing protein, partial [Nitrospirota bacterium]
RELENTIERMVIMTANHTVSLENIPENIKSVQSSAELIATEIPDEGLEMEKLLENIEKNLLQKALEKSGGVKTEAAKLLGLSFRSFRHRLQKYESTS